MVMGSNRQCLKNEFHLPKTRQRGKTHRKNAWEDLVALTRFVGRGPFTHPLGGNVQKNDTGEGELSERRANAVSARGSTSWGSK